MNRAKVEILAEDSPDVAYLRDLLENWRRVWERGIGSLPRQEISFQLDEVNLRRWRTRTTFPDLIVIYHRFPWEDLAERATRGGCRVVVYGIVGEAEEAIAATKRGYLYLSSRSHDMMSVVALAAAATAEPRLRGSLVRRLHQHPTAFIGDAEEWQFGQINFWSRALLAQFFGVIKDFFRCLPYTSGWPVLLSKCGDIRWITLRENILAHVRAKTKVAIDPNLTRPLQFLHWLFRKHMLPAPADLLRSDSKVVRLAMLEAIGRMPELSAKRALRLVRNDPDPEVIGELLRCIAATDCRMLYSYVIQMLDHEDEYISDTAAETCRTCKIVRSRDHILRLLGRRVSFDLLWAVRDLKIKEAIPALGRIAEDGEVYAGCRSEARAIANQLSEE